MPSSKAANKRSAPESATSTEAKQPKATESDELDDLFASAEVVAPKIVNKAGTNAADDGAPLDSTLKIPEGYSLAYNPGQTNTIKAVVTGASAKYNQNGPTSVRLTCKVLNIKNAGADVTRAGSMMIIALSKNDKVKDASGIDINARLIPTGTTPVLYKGTEIFSLTVTLGKITHQGLKEAEVSKLVPGAEVELRDVYYNTSGMGKPWLTCTDFKVTKTRASHDGVAFALGEIANCGTSLMLGAALNSAVFRGGEAPTVETKPCFDVCKELIENTKADLCGLLSGKYPSFHSPAEALKLEGSDTQVGPTLLFRKTKISPPDVEGKGLFFDNAKAALVYASARNGDPDKLAALFPGGAVVASDWGTTRSLTTHPTFGEMYVLPTKQSYIPNAGMLQSGAAPFTMKHVLAVMNAITIKVPLAVLAAQFGVNERETLELLMDNIYPVANMAFMGTKAMIYTRNYENDDYSQDVLIDSPNQLTVDVHGTLRNVGLRLSLATVSGLFGGAAFSTVDPISGESLVDMMGGDHKPVVSKLSANGGVASLREQSVSLNDDTLEFYGVVPNAIKIAMADGNLNCGTDETVGDAAFLAAGGGTVEGCAAMLKNRELAVFAVRVKTKTIATSTSAAE